MSDNPSAFPTEFDSAETGMTLRDWFAGKALPAVIAATSARQHRPHNGSSTVQGICLVAYALADAMLAARSHGSKANV